MQRLDVILFGPTPPPFAGISVHVERLARRLAEAHHHVAVYGPRSARPTRAGARRRPRLRSLPLWLLWRRTRSRGTLVCHFHDTGWRDRFVMGVIGALGFKVVLTVHGDSLENQLHCLSPLKTKMLTWSLRRLSALVCVNSHIAEVARSAGVRRSRVVVAPPFLEPDSAGWAGVPLPDDVRSFIDSHTPVLSANAGHIAFTNGIDLYGIDMCISLCARLRAAFPKIGFLFSLPEVGDNGYYRDLLRMVQAEHVEENFHFVHSAPSFPPLLVRSDVFLRPTAADGYGMSVAEALWAGVPAIASDVCERPTGTILFRSRDLDDLTTKTLDVVENREGHRLRIGDVKPEGNFPRLASVYESVAAGRPPAADDVRHTL